MRALPCASIVGLVLGSSPAFAQFDEMRFVVVRSVEAGCEPLCTEWISAEGEITSTSDDKFRETLKGLGKRRLPVVINSPGGDINAAMAIGRAIRKRGIDVLVGTTEFIGCQPSEKNCQTNRGRGAKYFGRPLINAFCNSACPLVLAGGAHRYAAPSAFIGVHQVTTTITSTDIVYKTKYKMVGGKKKILSKKIVSRKKGKTQIVTQMNQAIEKNLRSYLQEMGVSGIIVDRMKATDASDISWVDIGTRKFTKLVENLDNSDMVLSSAACQSVPAASHCRLITTDDL
ncbi:hypothetical protein DY251_17815 [Mesorhizobium denitrificans]|uniref:Periplasmic binding protein domain-containing protein n=2 Tax=Phyllobacteriaceae TaxID=69277 RepID=A0A371X6H7_9HYPH|nr:hypothetical protein DY251_17815 [Mesorhizobium denitrificans]